MVPTDEDDDENDDAAHASSSLSYSVSSPDDSASTIDELRDEDGECEDVDALCAASAGVEGYKSSLLLEGFGMSFTIV